ncbi:DUF6249 domain-containing protein [Chitinophaga sp. NPDC101104]|uniref:DUF6249 domain-containing protein n=1 Tax=Chitinophaga sp. NPDC101104 TaxID=3390561 RepID=UPI003D08A7DD
MPITLTILLISLGIFVFFTWYFSHKARHTERLRLIEKGIDPDTTKNNDNSGVWKNLGVVAIGLGVGLLVISILALVNPQLINVNSMPLGILVLCCGISLVIANKYSK